MMGGVRTGNSGLAHVLVESELLTPGRKATSRSFFLLSVRTSVCLPTLSCLDMG